MANHDLSETGVRPTPLVSVLIPSRARPAHLIGAIDSLLKTAADPGNIECVVRLDDDDRRYANLFDHLKSGSGLPIEAGLKNVKVLFGPRGRGYADLHLMYNQCAAEARGTWLFQFNDDMRMESPGWDLTLGTICTRDVIFLDPPVLVNPVDHLGRMTTVSPIVRRAAVVAMGHFSLNAYCDAWIGQVCALWASDCTSIRVRHLIDQMADENTASQAASKAWEEFEGSIAKGQRATDQEIVRALVGYRAERQAQ